MGEVVVVGGGAAGLAAAVTAADAGDRVTVLERMDRVGRKLLATGNGRCNLMNAGPARYPGGEAFARAVLSRCGPREQTAFWRGLGLRVRTEDGGRVYPVSGQASSVLDTLRLALRVRGVAVATDAPAEDITRAGGVWAVRAGGQTYRGDRVIVAGGGRAQPRLGSDGSCLKLLARLGQPVTATFPALTQIVAASEPIRGLAGIRVRAEVAIVRGGHALHRESGELLFTDYGISGVCAMQCARWARDGGTVARIRLTEGLGFSGRDEARGEIARRAETLAGEPLESLLTGLCVPRLAAALLRAAGIAVKGRAASALTAREADALADTLDGFQLDVTGVKGFDQAQVTSGGADTAQFDPATMESRLLPGLYAAGEVLDVDGDCGGFNLMFAFGSGMLAGWAGRMEKHDHC